MSLQIGTGGWGTTPDYSSISRKSARRSRGELTSAFVQVSYYAFGKETEVAEVKKNLDKEDR